MRALAIGAMLRAIGPQGFFVRASDEPSIFVATGTGLAPLRSMLLDALARGSRTPVALLLGFRHEHDIIYREELDALVREHGHLTVAITLSQPQVSWDGRRGYVQSHLPEIAAALARRAASSPPMLHVYACGPERMVAVVRKVTREGLGLDRRQLHGEGYD